MRAALILILAAACSSTSSDDCVSLAADAPNKIAGRLGYYTNGCTADSDCVLIAASLSCFNGCQQAVLAFYQTDAVNDLSGHNDDICMGASCNINIGCNPSFAACMSGQCVTVEGDAGVPDAGVPDAGNLDFDAGP